ncbi:hypothetical protein AAFF39_06425 [Lactococcus garvieae]
MAKNRIKELRNSANPKITLKELSDKLKKKDYPLQIVNYLIMKTVYVRHVQK